MSKVHEPPTLSAMTGGAVPLRRRGRQHARLASARRPAASGELPPAPAQSRLAVRTGDQDRPLPVDDALVNCFLQVFHSGICAAAAPWKDCHGTHFDPAMTQDTTFF